MAVQLSDIVKNRMKEKLARGEVVSSMTVRLVRTIEIAYIARTAGFDSIYVDIEHNSFSFDAVGQICIAAMEAGVTPLVRVPTRRSEYVSRVLDGGAMGVIVPHIRSAAEAREVVAAAKFPPLGERSASGGLPHLQYRSFPIADANKALNDATIVMVQFETADALERADEIMAVEGVDMVMIGANDLMADMGIAGQFDHQLVKDAYATAIAACRKHGKYCGVGGLSSRPDLVAQFVKMGARYVSTGTDLSFLLGACTQKAKQVRDLPL